MNDVRIPYNKNLLGYAKENRKNPTFAEKKLWKLIRRKQLGVDFNRQKPLISFIVDFYCISLKLAIELDGGSHDENKYSYDIMRQKELEKLGITFLRFTEYEILNKTDNVLETISMKITEIQEETPLPSPLIAKRSLREKRG